MKNRIISMGLALAATLIAGCASLSPTQTLVVNVAVQQGVSKFIEHKETPAERSQRATEIIRVVAILKTTVSGDAATIETLQAQALEIVKASKLELSDQALANTLIASVGDVLRERVAAGVLKPDDAIRVSAMLDNIAATAQVYVTSPASAELATRVRAMLLAEIDRKCIERTARDAA